MASLQFRFSSSFAVRPTSRHRRPTALCSDDRQALFNRIAPVYDNLNDLLSFGQHRVWKRMAISWTGAKTGYSVLDLCCGSGDLAFLLSEKVGSSGKVIGLDFSKEQLVVASARQNLWWKSCYHSIEWLEGDATDLPFSDCQFDAITMGYGLRNVVDKGGKASILDFNKTTQPFVASFQEWMIDNVVVPVATGYGLADEYEYLKSSIREFLTGKELEELATNAGFSNATHYEISGGLMGNLVATR
ncbi:2-phytyl-1,4-beta-naphthoquinone methyltransferase, chloroplastic [Linum grandiflorum]